MKRTQIDGYEYENSVTWNDARTKIMAEKPTPEWNKILRANGIYRRHDMQIFDSFHRFPIIDPYNNMTTTREYIFFVKPDLNIYINDEKGFRLNPVLSPFFFILDSRGYGKTVLRELQFSLRPSRPFLNILSNRAISTIDLPGISSSGDVETNQTYSGSKMKYRHSSIDSDEEYDFSVEFEDTRYLEIYLLFKAYDEYERLKGFGVVQPRQEYIDNKILHDVMAVYKIIVGEDGETIIHFAKLWYVYPTNVPRDIFSNDVGQDGHLKITIQFKGMWIQDMEPDIIYEFNFLSSLMSNYKTEVPIWDNDIQAVSGELVYRPVIVRDTNGKGEYGYQMYKLKWFK